MGLHAAFHRFNEIDRLRGEFDHAFTGFAPRAAAFPPVNVWAGPEGVAVAAELPGLSAEDIEITVKDDRLTIAGERAAPEGKGALLRRERAFGKFRRVIQLPFRVESDKVEARFEHGVLAIELPRPEADKPRRIAINA